MKRENPGSGLELYRWPLQGGIDWRMSRPIRIEFAGALPHARGHVYTHSIGHCREAMIGPCLDRPEGQAGVRCRVELQAPALMSSNLTQAS